ncbi:MAG: T9SS type A sorting domain-containing protein [Saprospirales bacterium]|nr:T9SS type A sorting domain-containing protein [Saprospirales bacterium]
MRGVVPENTHIRVFDRLGRLMLENTGTSTELDLSVYPAGLYLIEVLIDKETHVQRIIKQ